MTMLLDTDREAAPVAVGEAEWHELSRRAGVDAAAGTSVRPSAAPASRPGAQRMSRRLSRAANGIGVLALVAAVAMMIYQLRSADLGSVLSHLRWGHALLAVAFIAASLCLAAYNLAAFSSLRLRWPATIAAQLAVSGLRLVAPSAVSTPAIATRFLTRSGAAPLDAVATVAAAQSAQLLVTTVGVAALGAASGSGVNLPASSTVWWAALGLVMLVGVVWLALRTIERLRAAVIAVSQSVRDLGAHARRRPLTVAGGVAAAAGLTTTHVLAFAFCLSAVGGSASYLSLIMIYLAGASAGSLVPTPGGVGAVEATMTAGLVATGVALPVAVAAVLLNRVVAVWLPAVPGWFALVLMRRQQLI
ncbi:flippase-like domain-containing protein [Jatrophihabitans telluris]|uniref:Flippase-like domain-containing protein n=1 Tax=Jatrophihabitans telluris TaxID=2038343 RepID=A0ABY4QUV5_9ACTN|nr:lysylphosphatidylglycerol synthase transmembrane domain-containing protein [Jatrophihabitans telluris]UQX86902.1 flippase-like domain-containing protein [Jatrophihabitans telluris]